jgi:BirA family transcriptional regulator, biotin operon repressor / biotin---[acetyl-CoA-carboxylase] ligase
VTSEALHVIARWLGCQKILMAECGSTNDEAARLARAGAKHGTVVIAERQTAGRGRDGHVWTSPPGGLYLSAVLRPSLPLVAVPPMTLAIGIGVCDAARQAGAAAVLKWPNDVLVGGKKLAGVLVEAQSQGGKLDSVIVGIGINLINEVPEHAISLAEARGQAIDRGAFILSLLAAVERWVDRYVASGIEAIIPAWQDRMAIGLAARATIDGAPVVGSMHGLDLDGALLVRDDTGRIHRVRSGDVEVLRGAC